MTNMQISDPNYQGFQLPSVINPPDSLCFTIKVPNDPGHIAAFFGVLFDLTQWINWQRDPLKRGKDAAAVWRGIWTELQAQSCNVPSAPRGAEIEDFMPLRVDCNCNVFITCCDGTEKQILTSDQVKALIAGSAVQGAPQPSAGACQDYNLTINGGQLQIVPTIVNAGDTIELMSAVGASTEDGVGWQCPDGSIYFAGACAGGGFFDASALLPSVHAGKVILFLNGVYHDLTVGTPFTVPSGVTNQTPSIVLNYNPASTHISGQIQCDVKVCNSAAARWSHTFNFITSQGPFVPTVHPGPYDLATYTPGTGWKSVISGADTWLSFFADGLPSAHYDTIGATYNAVRAPTSFDAGSGNNSGTGDQFFPLTPLSAGTGIMVAKSITPYTATNFRLDLTELSVATNPDYVITSLTLGGSGASPF